HCDHLGTPVALINHKTGKVEWDAISDVWGNAVDIFNPYKLRQPIRMQGQHVDEESGLHYNRHRYYDPALGRYITQDPIGLRGGWNLYAYVYSKPGRYIDPRGLNGVGSMVNMPGISEKGSLGISMTQNGASSEDVTTAMAPAPTSPIATGECRVTGTVAVGTGLSATASLNEKSGASALWSVPIAAVGLRASATCGLKFRDPDAKDLKVGAGFALGLGEFSIEAVQTSTWPEIYIGFGAGAGPEINIPYTPSVSGPINY
ncbi:RHS repeat-associated core domain-containing protein, partial [Rahnella laticis]